LGGVFRNLNKHLDVPYSLLKGTLSYFLLNKWISAKTA
jgi:hypothetical protein